MVPDGCYRHWDLHPLSLVKDGRCAVTMMHECFTTRRTIKVWEEGRPKRKSGYVHAMTEEQIEKELDLIFTELGYVPNEYQFERGWREDGCTSKMILKFAAKHNIACRIYRDAVGKGNEMECF